jgi:ATP-dependent DNA helicase RecQ
MTIQQTLRDVFGFEAFRDGQERVIQKLLDGQSALAVFPTGSGKSLCYQLPALHLEGLTLVISPLIALMKDQIDFLRGRGVAAARLDSSVPVEEYRRVDAELRAGALKLLYVAPERLSNERFIQKLRGLKIALLVIDEAHCISEWGHNFRPDYLKLARLSRQLGFKRVLTLTATATPEVAEDICSEFGIGADAFVHTGFYRPNLELRIAPCGAKERIPTLLQRLQSRQPGPTIVYVTLQRTSEMVAAALVEARLPARAYHAGMKNEERDAVQDWFMKSTDAIVIATIAFGMGIDKADIRYVYHLNLPKSLENYSQEIGRAGRDGGKAICEVLACGDDIIVLENFTYGDTPDAPSIGALVDDVLGRGGEFDVSVYELSRAHDVRPLVVTTLLAYLELADVIEATAPFYTEYQFRPLRPSQEILAKFDGERAEFLRELFRCATKAAIWFHIDLAKTSQRLESTRDRIVKALNYLEEQGDLVLKVAGLRHGYRLKSRPEDMAALKQKLSERFETRENNDILRVEQVVELAEDPGCIVRRLLAHFGEDLGRDCGHCSVCLGEPARSISSESPPAPAFDISSIRALRREHPEALATPRRVARFLCGLTSPLLTATKLSKHPLFGAMAEAPFREVMAAVT